MLITAEEAKSKYCCQDITKKCRAEECMGWTWCEIWHIATEIIDSKQQYKEVYKGYCWHLNEPKNAKVYYGSE